MRLTSTDTLGVVTLPQETVDTTDWESETSLGRTAEKDVSFGSSIRCDMKIALFWTEKARHGRRIEVKVMEKEQYSRLRVGLGTAGLASGLASSHFD